jgi:hypothetical protein
MNMQVFRNNRSNSGYSIHILNMGHIYIIDTAATPQNINIPTRSE